MYFIINSTFCMIVVISNIISTKMVKLPLFQDMVIPAGLITYPLTFFLSDLATELYGVKKAKHMVHHAFAMSLLSYLIIKIALILPGSNVENSNHFEEILGLNGIILFASLTAYMISQTVDIQLYALIKKWTGAKYLWMRNNGSTCIAQLVDTVVMNVIFLKIGMDMATSQTLQIMAFSYVYKCMFSVVLTPLFYFLVSSLGSQQYTAHRKV